MKLTDEQTSQLKAVLEKAKERPDCKHLLVWELTDILRPRLKAYGQSWVDTAGPVSDRSGSPYEAADEYVGNYENKLMELVAEIMLRLAQDN